MTEFLFFFDEPTLHSIFLKQGNAFIVHYFLLMLYYFVVAHNSANHEFGVLQWLMECMEIQETKNALFIFCLVQTSGIRLLLREKLNLFLSDNIIMLQEYIMFRISPKWKYWIHGQD